MMSQIIAQTAKFVRQAGKQSIFVLRVKQEGNPNFAFLKPDDSLHAYFQWLVDTSPEEIPPMVRCPNCMGFWKCWILR